ncbi:MAG: hypothetical protein COB54_01315 [Alphaproteobacteria bacterium]|nr:MAG: hypothetical protein COB54_01315 [Alphaproteobacteria bacterium]
MMPDSRGFTGMETTVTYLCPTCEATVEIQSMGQAGLKLAVGLIVLAVVTFMVLENPGPWDMVDYLLYSGFVFVVLYLPASILIPHWAHRVTGERDMAADSLDFGTDDFARTIQDPVQKGIIRFERFGFLGGFIAPLIFIALVLGAATLIGMINFYYF